MLRNLKAGPDPCGGWLASDSGMSASEMLSDPSLSLASRLPHLIATGLRFAFIYGLALAHAFFTVLVSDCPP